MKNYTLKANHDLVLPDGKTKIKTGEVFEWTGSLGLFGSCTIVVGEKDVDETVGKEVKKTAQLRTRAKESGETPDNGENANVGK